MTEDEFLSLVSDMYEAMAKGAERALRRPNGLILPDPRQERVEGYHQNGPAIVRSLSLMAMARKAMGKPNDSVQDMSLMCGILWGHDAPEGDSEETQEAEFQLRSKIMAFMIADEPDAHGITYDLVAKGTQKVYELMSNGGQHTPPPAAIHTASWLTGCMVGKHLADMDAFESLSMEDLK